MVLKNWNKFLLFRIEEFGEKGALI
jgi:hypothetical protein